MWVGGSGATEYLPVFGSKPTSYQSSQSKIMFENFSSTMLQERVIQHVKLDLDKLLNTGDLLVSRRWTGYTATMMLLSGSFATNVAMVVKKKNEIYIIES
jgi:hypothetical protein